MEPPKMTWDMDDLNRKDESSGSDSPEKLIFWDFLGFLWISGIVLELPPALFLGSYSHRIHGPRGAASVRLVVGQCRRHCRDQQIEVERNHSFRGKNGRITSSPLFYFDNGFYG